MGLQLRGLFVLKQPAGEIVEERWYVQILPSQLAPIGFTVLLVHIKFILEWIPYRRTVGYHLPRWLHDGKTPWFLIADLSHIAI